MFIMCKLWENYRERPKKSQIFEIDLRIFLFTIFPGPGMDLPAARDMHDKFVQVSLHNYLSETEGANGAND